ncbi:hypothetical protein ACNI5M_24695, partial [Klebsiella pneumoniae]
AIFLLIRCYSCHKGISGSRAVKISPEIRVVSGLTPPGEFIQVVTRDALRKNRQHKQDFMDYRQRVRE